jgi:hypothetical protein
MVDFVGSPTPNRPMPHRQIICTKISFPASTEAPKPDALAPELASTKQKSLYIQF